MAAKCIHKLHRCAQESKKIGEGADDKEQEEVHLKVLHPKVRRNARQLRVLGSFIATHDNVPKKIRAADQSKRDSSDSECCGGSKSSRRRSVDRTAARHTEAR